MPEIQPSLEMSLLLSCARTRLDQATAAGVRTLAGGEIDWPHVHQLARRHSVLPLVYRSLYTNCPELVPVELLDQMRLEYHANTARSMDLTEKLLKILNLFEHDGIEVIPFKGPILAKVVYGDQALRLTGDLDLLVRKEDVPSANELLQSEGFQPEYRLDGFGQNVNLHGPGACHFTRDDINIDLHWEIAPRIFTYDFDSAGYWSRLNPVSVDGKDLQVLSMGDRLLMLCGHGVRNAWSQLVWICDVTETVKQMSPTDFDRAYEQVISIGSVDILHFGLSLAHDLIHADLPEYTQNQIRSDSNIGLQVHQVITRLVRDTDTLLSGPRWLRFQLQVRRHYMDKARFLWRLTTTPNVDDLARKQLPSRFSFLYLFHRAVRLMSKYVLSPRVDKLQINRSEQDQLTATN